MQTQQTPLRPSSRLCGVEKPRVRGVLPAKRMRGRSAFLALETLLAQRRSPSMAPLFFRPSMAGAPLGYGSAAQPLRSPPCCACSCGRFAGLRRPPSMAAAYGRHPCRLSRFSPRPSMAGHSSPSFLLHPLFGRYLRCGLAAPRLARADGQGGRTAVAGPKLLAGQKPAPRDQNRSHLPRAIFPPFISAYTIFLLLARGRSRQIDVSRS